MSKGIFIPDITVEMIRKAPLEAIETLLVEGEMYDVDMPKWIPCSERLPNKDGRYLVCTDWAQDNIEVIRWADGWNCFRDFDGNVYRKSELDRDTIIAWMPLPMPLEGEGDD